MTIFEKASKQKLRFNSNRGDLTAEQLWDLPLQSKSGFDLDTIAKQVNRELKDLSDESFVSRSSTPGKSRMELQLDILKHIIAEKINSAQEAEKRANQATERNKLLDILASKQEESLKGLTVEEIQKRIKELES